MVTITYKRRGQRRAATTPTQPATEPGRRASSSASAVSAARSPYGAHSQFNHALAQMQAELDALRRPAKNDVESDDGGE